MQVNEVIKPTTPEQQRINQLKQQLDTAKLQQKRTNLNQQQTKLNQQRANLNKPNKQTRKNPPCYQSGFQYITN